ncbi:Cell division protein DivIB [bioreactor metagenome]|uniref:Cell division protein DivIB n=1 Tax=bioreactor metagenome TaxID=1076179 RepID=A0A645IDH3_9ZZZZ
MLTFNSVLEHRIAENPLIQSVTVTKQSGRNVLIRIQEKRIIGYTYLDQAYLVLADNTLVELAADKQAVIAELPLLVDFDNSEIAAGIGSALDKLSLEVLRNISEIHRYSTSYDENMLKIVMIDGNLIYTSLNAIDTVNNYFSILEVLKVSNSCIFIEDSSKTAYSSSCPAAATADAAAEN